MDEHGLAFGDFILDRRRGTLARGDRELTLRRKSFAVLQYLAENPGRLVPREELFQAVWGHVVVTDGTLTQCLIDIRRALDDRSQTIVRTVRGRGVRFELAVTERIEPAVAPVPELAPPSSCDAPAVVAPTVPRSPIPPAAAAGRRWTRLGLAAAASVGLLLLAGAAHMQAGHPMGAGPDASAHEHLVQARHFYNRRAEGDLERAEQLYQQALGLAPDSAEAWVGLSAVYSLRALEGQGTAEHLATAEHAAQRALALDPASVEAHLRLARVVAAQGDEARARQLSARAAALDPEHPLVLAKRGGAAVAEGKLEEAVALHRRALEADPLSLVNHVNVATLLLAAGRAAEAEDAARHALVLHPPGAGGMHRAEQILADALILQGRLDEVTDVVGRWPAGHERDRAEVLIHASRGDAAATAASVTRLQTDEGWQAALRLAEIHARAGVPAEARRWLATALERATGAGTPLEVRQMKIELAVSPFVREVTTDVDAVRLAAG